MTEDRVAPRTAAGRNLADHLYITDGGHWEQDIRAIEDEARQDLENGLRRIAHSQESDLFAYSKWVGETARDLLGELK